MVLQGDSGSEVRRQLGAATSRGTLWSPGPKKAETGLPWSPPGRWGAVNTPNNSASRCRVAADGSRAGRRDHTQTRARLQACQGPGSSVSPPRPKGPLTCTHQGRPERRTYTRTLQYNQYWQGQHTLAIPWGAQKNVHNIPRYHLPSRPSSSWNSQLPTVSRKELTTVTCHHPARGSFSVGRSSQREIQSGRARAQGGQGLMGLDRVSGVE